jgi:hypothetical protein
MCPGSSVSMFKFQLGKNVLILILEFFRPNFEEEHHNFAGIEIQAKLS